MTRPETSALVALIEQIVDARVEARLAQLGVHIEQYDGAHLPPHTSRRAFFAACRAAGKVEGARRDGRGWTCTRTAWEQYRARGAARPVRGCAKSHNNVVSIDSMLVAAGLRATRGVGR